jgi:hypothetical protein
VLEDARADPLAAVSGGCAHGLDLAAARVDLVQRSTAEQFTARPGRPEGDARGAQALEVEGMHALGRGDRVHVIEVIAQEADDLRACQFVLANLEAEHYFRNFIALIRMGSGRFPVLFRHFLRCRKNSS